MPDATATGGTITCSTTSVQLMGSSTVSGVTYSWTDPNGEVIEGQNPTVSGVGTYTLTVTNPANGCSQTTTAVVTEDIAAPDASAAAHDVTARVAAVTASDAAGEVAGVDAGAVVGAVDDSAAAAAAAAAVGVADGVAMSDAVCDTGATVASATVVMPHTIA